MGDHEKMEVGLSQLDLFLFFCVSSRKENHLLLIFGNILGFHYFLHLEILFFLVLSLILESKSGIFFCV